jgi:hypothetical protein
LFVAPARGSGLAFLLSPLILGFLPPRFAYVRGAFNCSRASHCGAFSGLLLELGIWLLQTLLPIALSLSTDANPVEPEPHYLSDRAPACAAAGMLARKYCCGSRILEP